MKILFEYISFLAIFNKKHAQMKNFTFLLLILSACTSPTAQVPLSKDAVAFTNVNIIDVRNGNVLANQMLLVDSGKIILIDKEIELPTETQIIDGSGKYIMPGLAEMHAHIPSPDWGRKSIEETLFLYLANGVTTIRGMLGHPAHLILREQALKNEVLSPRVFTSSPSLNGRTIPTIADAREKITKYKNDGYDFLKLHPGIKLEVFEEVVQVANEVGIPYAGHVSLDIGIQRALENKYASVDHVDGFIEGLVADGTDYDPNNNGFFGYNFTDLVDTTKIDQLVSLTKKNQVWVVPTQTLYDRWFSPTSGETLADEPEMKYMPKSMLEGWISRKNELIANENYDDDQWERFVAIRRSIILKLHRNGHGLLLGSDAPQVFNVPGFSIYHELKSMTNAGLTNLEAIQIGTLNPARYFGMEGQFGEIIGGASADFMLLDNNPLDDLSNLRNPTGVMVRGKWLSRIEIDKQLAEIARNMISE
jgi:imidazolonepropionase-like amidohydrolase